MLLRAKSARWRASWCGQAKAKATKKARNVAITMLNKAARGQALAAQGEGHQECHAGRPHAIDWGSSSVSAGLGFCDAAGTSRHALH